MSSRVVKAWKSWDSIRDFHQLELPDCIISYSRAQLPATRKHCSYNRHSVMPSNCCSSTSIYSSIFLFSRVISLISFRIAHVRVSAIETVRHIRLALRRLRGFSPFLLFLYTVASDCARACDCLAAAGPWNAALLYPTRHAVNGTVGCTSVYRRAIL